MTRITLKEAERLGLLSGGRGRQVTKSVSAASMRPRKPAKGGRIPKDQPHDQFDLRLSIPLQAKTKERARTMLPKPEIMKAFTSAKGSAAAFAGMLEAIKHRSYTPEATKAFENAVRALAAAAMRGREAYAGPVHIDIVFALAGDPQTWPTDMTDPDLDNAVKAIWDAFNKIVWRDDGLVVSKCCIKTCAPEANIAVRVRDAASAPLWPDV